MKPNDLRRDVRLEARVPVIIHHGRARVPYETLDVSFRGLFVVGATQLLPIRSLLRLKLDLPKISVETHGMVIHTGTNEIVRGIGVQFWGLTGVERAAWNDYVWGLLHERAALVKRMKAAAEGSLPSTTMETPIEPMVPSGVRPVMSDDAPKSPRASND